MTEEYAISNKHEGLAVGLWRWYLFPMLLLIKDDYGHVVVQLVEALHCKL